MLQNALQILPQKPVTVTKQMIGSEEINAVNARDLWKELESGQKFADWIKQRIEEYDFTQGVDFSTFRKIMKREGSFGSTTSTEYFITLDMAKELSMVERTEKGKQARRYFIECERKSRLADNANNLYIDRIRKALLLDSPQAWEKLYPDSFFTAIMRLHGQEFTGNSSTPSYCGNVIGRWIYDVVLPPQLRKEITSSKGAEKQHQWFSEQGGRRVLLDQINKVELIANISDSRSAFEAHCKRAFPVAHPLSLFVA